MPVCKHMQVNVCIVYTTYIWTNFLHDCSRIASLKVFPALLFSTAAKKVGAGKTGNEAIIRVALIEGVAS